MIRLHRMKRLLTIITLVALLFTSLSLSSFVKPAEAMTFSCDFDIRTIEREYKWIMSLEESYEQSMYFANAPLHREYHEEHLENAQDTLKLIVNTLYYIGTLVGKLTSCTGLESYSYEQFAGIMKNILLRFSTPFYDRDLGLDAMGLDKQYSRLVLNIKQLEEHESFKSLYYDVVLNDPAVTKTTERYLQNLYSGLIDRFLYRTDSYDKDAAFMSNLSVVTDGILLAKKQLDKFLDELTAKEPNPNSYSNEQVKVSEAGKKTFMFILKDNLSSMGVRAMYKTAIEQQMIYPNMDPTHQAFSEDFAGNLSSFMISTDIISFALSYTEMVGDLYDYIDKQVGAVFDAAKDDLAEYERLKKEYKHQEQLFVQVNTFAQKVADIKFNPTISEEQYAERFEKLYYEFNDELKDIYRVDKSVIKIYVNGKLLNIPEKAYIENGTTMVPLRVIAEELDVEPKWNSKDNTITITTTKNMLSLGKPMDIIFKIGSKSVQTGPYYSDLAVAPTVKNGVTFVPLSFVAQNLGLNVKWVGESSSVVLTSRGIR